MDPFPAEEEAGFRNPEPTPATASCPLPESNKFVKTVSISARVSPGALSRTSTARSPW